MKHAYPFFALSLLVSPSKILWASADQELRNDPRYSTVAKVEIKASSEKEMAEAALRGSGQDDYKKYEDLRTMKLKSPWESQAGKLGFQGFDQSDFSSGDLSPLGPVTDVVEIGKAVWDIVKDGEAVVKDETETAAALPPNRHWTEITGWSEPVTHVYKMVLTNLFGIETVQYYYRVLYTYGGSVDGKGRYLTNVAVVPGYVKVLWGYVLESSAKSTGVTNVGTKDSPVASMGIQLKYKAGSVLRKDLHTINYQITGTGDFKEIGAIRK